MSKVINQLTSLLKRRPNSRGQSLVELALVLALLMFMVVAIIEYGFMLNNYLVLMDAARDAARQGSLADPFMAADPSQLDPNFYARPDTNNPVSPTNPPGISDLVENSLNSALPSKKAPNSPDCVPPAPNAPGCALDKADGDDIIISFYSVDNGVPTLFPYAGGYSRYGNHTTRFSTADVQALLNASAPGAGVLVVEIYYNYHQILNLPIFSNVVPNPLLLYTYAIMPLSGAEPTPTAIP